MSYILVALGFLLLVVAVVKQLDSKGVQPVLTAYALVTTSGFLGMAAFTSMLPLLANSTGVAVTSGMIGLAYLGVAGWGFRSLKRHHLGV